MDESLRRMPIPAPPVLPQPKANANKRPKIDSTIEYMHRRSLIEIENNQTAKPEPGKDWMNLDNWKESAGVHVQPVPKVELSSYGRSLFYDDNNVEREFLGYGRAAPTNPYEVDMTRVRGSNEHDVIIGNKKDEQAQPVEGAAGPSAKKRHLSNGEDESEDESEAETDCTELSSDDDSSDGGKVPVASKSTEQPVKLKLVSQLKAEEEEPPFCCVCYDSSIDNENEPDDDGLSDLDFAIDLYATPCGHNYCWQCLQSMMSTMPIECKVCKVQLFRNSYRRLKA